ncbi:EF-hand calcium-binding domain-containing protein 14 isoform X2 [Sorex fumeus]|uniref:EF-hand calcium-binding domain-containing protein 14 isoform X2 n=1 Tax=Sorex fumeus TaxID=62283 RepID=UPI0024ADD435|nr:EF-hand calcium-binding domain-containing protein 14 isoform X2 [Sorex fumeus]
MKKRKELNALIGLAGESRRKKPKRGSGHRLLRTEPPDSDSESSSEEEEGFGVVGSRPGFAKGDYVRCCKICYPLCAFVILAACVVACVGLVWMQVALKEDLDALKEKFRTMESNQKSSFQEIPKLNEELISKQKQLEKIESGELGLNKVWINITEMNKQVSLLTSLVNHLKANVKSASDLINLPATVEGLQKSVASIGSTLNSVHLAVETIQKTVDEHKKTIELLRSDMDILYLHHSLEEVNSTLVGHQRQNDLKLKGKNETVSNLTKRVSLIEKDLVAKSKVEKQANLSVSLKEDISDSQVSKLREKLQLISALTNKPESNRPPETISADLQDLFHKTGQDVNGKLTYQEISNSLGSAVPEPESFRVFDSNGDGRYSLPELRAALGV